MDEGPLHHYLNGFEAFEAIIAPFHGEWKGDVRNLLLPIGVHKRGTLNHLLVYVILFLTIGLGILPTCGLCASIQCEVYDHHNIIHNLRRIRPSFNHHFAIIKLLIQITNYCKSSFQIKQDLTPGGVWEVWHKRNSVHACTLIHWFLNKTATTARGESNQGRSMISTMVTLKLL